MRGLVVPCAALVLTVLAAAPAAADEPPFVHYVGLQTAALEFPPYGTLVLSLGAEYLPDVNNDLAGVRGELARFPTVGIGLGLSDNALFQITWPAFNRLRVHSQVQPPILGLDLGGVSTGWGDVTAATLIQIRPPDGASPGFGIKFAAELPNSNEKLGIGDNSTDVFASILLADRPVRRLALYGDVGLGILSDRKAVFTQNDVLTFGVLADWQVNDGLHAVGETAGRWSTHRAGPETGSRAELRGGVEIGRGATRTSVLLVEGVDGWSSGLGVSVNVTTQIAALKRRH
ncbi:MAG: hypothetical protein HY076_00900 [Candidatus Eisenbacteria bacterium]|uniref:Transporter n=1 Tax=Eiseniibacteriota bacterium TaxID=2212470 RepID=A0A9D6L6M3_UNCEI|nr:hypothetical protein [Candidatus Eisenbacteria bacterium]MBI3538819.1 hypothetical protein [Candidatus Eisenbacteria bacterium]